MDRESAFGLPKAAPNRLLWRPVFRSESQAVLPLVAPQRRGPKQRVRQEPPPVQPVPLGQSLRLRWMELQRLSGN